MLRYSINEWNEFAEVVEMVEKFPMRIEHTIQVCGHTKEPNDNDSNHDHRVHNNKRARQSMVTISFGFITVVYNCSNANT